MSVDPGISPQKELSRLKIAARKVEKEMDARFPELGRLAYNAFLEAPLPTPEMNETASAIRLLAEEAAGNNARIEELRAIIQANKASKRADVVATAAVQRCQNCGAPLVSGASFCGNCGAVAVAAPAVQEAAPAATPAGVTCASCGATTPDPDASFCGNCGAKFG